MKRVLIVCSVHRETGKATAGELGWLLSRLRPDVLFLECSSTDFSAFLDGSFSPGESAAVMDYRKRNEVMLEPVDLHLPNAKFLKSKADELFETIATESAWYCQLVSASHHRTEEGGLAYLNGPDSARLESEIQREMRATVESVESSKLTELYELWIRTNDLREQEMIRRVELFASHTSFKKGVLLVGAAHRLSLFEKLQVVRSDSACAVDWDFDWHHEVANP